MKSYWIIPKLFAVITSALMLYSCAQNTPEAVFSRAERAMSEGDIIGASLYFEEFLEKFPEHQLTMQVYNYLANCHMMLKDYGNARAVFYEVKKKYGDENPRIALTCEFQIGRTYMEEGNIKAAEEHFQGIIESATEAEVKYNAHQSLAMAYAQQKRTEDAAEQFDTMVQIAEEQVKDPTQSFYLKLEAMVGNAADGVPGKADILKASQEFEEARDVYKSTLDIINSVTGIYGIENEKQNVTIGWAHTWAEAGDYISAATTYDQLLNNPAIMDPVKPRLITFKIQSLERLLQAAGETNYSPENRAALVKENLRLVEGYPETTEGRQAMIRIAQLVEDSTPEMAEEYLEKVIAEFEQEISEPSSRQGPLNAMFGIADAYIKMEQFDKAKEALDRVKSAHSNIPEVQQQVQQWLYYVQQVENRAQQEAAAPPADEAIPAVPEDVE